MYKQGYSASDIHKKYQRKASRGNVWYIIKKAGLPVRKYKRTLLQEQIEEIKKLYNGGEGIESLQKKYKLRPLAKYLKDFGIQKRSRSEVRRKYHINENYFEKIDTEGKAYFLGFIYADGWLTKGRSRLGISLCKKDVDILIKFKEMLGYTGNFTSRRERDFVINGKTRRSKEQLGLSINNKKIHSDLVKHGLVPNKSLILKFPSGLDKHLLRHFIRGYFDGDGSIILGSNRKWSISMISTYSFIKECQKIALEQIKIHLPVSKRGKIFVFQKGGVNQVKVVLDWLYKDSTVFLQRKYDRYKTFLLDIENRAKLRSCKYNCIRLLKDGSSNKFLVEIKQNKVTYRLGRFNSLDDAILARNAKAKELNINRHWLY